MSAVLLVLYVFLQSSASLGWFAVDPKLIGAVGIVFVVLALLEGFVFYAGRHPFAHRV